MWPSTDSDVDTDEVAPGGRIWPLSSGGFVGSWLGSGHQFRTLRSAVPEKILIPFENNPVKVLKTQQQPPCRRVSGSDAGLGVRAWPGDCLWLHPQGGLSRRFLALVPESSKVRRGLPWFLGELIT